MKKPPKSNLSPLSEPWGRYVENSISAINTLLERMTGGFSADASFQNSTLDNLASQIRELEQRALQAVSAPDMLSAIYDAGNATVSTTMTLPAPNESRMAVISASCAPSATTPRDRPRRVKRGPIRPTMRIAIPVARCSTEMSSSPAAHRSPMLTIAGVKTSR